MNKMKTTIREEKKIKKRLMSIWNAMNHQDYEDSGEDPEVILKDFPKPTADMSREFLKRYPRAKKLMDKESSQKFPPSNEEIAEVENTMDTYARDVILECKDKKNKNKAYCKGVLAIIKPQKRRRV